MVEWGAVMRRLTFCTGEQLQTQWVVSSDLGLPPALAQLQKWILTLQGVGAPDGALAESTTTHQWSCPPKAARCTWCAYSSVLAARRMHNHATMKDVDPLESKRRNWVNPFTVLAIVRDSWCYCRGDSSIISVMLRVLRSLKSQNFWNMGILNANQHNPNKGWNQRTSRA